MAEPARTIIVMDGSGSMWGQIDGRTKLEIARETLGTVLGTIPAEQELGLMAYGHRERGNCSDIELMVPPAAGTGAEIAARVNAMRFQGKTPLSESVRQAAEVLRFGEAPATVVLVTDGLETCEADPCALGRELEAAGLNFTAHVIGFGLTGAEGAQVACLATETGGLYLEASTAGALTDALTTAVASAAAAQEAAPPRNYFPGAQTMPGIALAPTGRTTGADETLPQEFGFAPDGSAEDCAALCSADTGCAAWRYEPRGSLFVEEARCFAFPASTEMNYETYPVEEGWVSGVKDGTLMLVRPYAPSATLPEARLSAPASAPAGSVLRVTFEGPHEEFDHIRVLDANGDWQAEAAVGAEPFVDVRLPFDLGAYELAYVYRAAEVIARQPLQITEAVVTLTAPESAPAGSTLLVDWTGPGTAYDYITLVDAAGNRLAEASVGDASPVELGLPWATGAFTLTYRFQNEEVIFSRPITLTEAPVSIEAPATAQVGTEVTITWVGPAAPYDNVQLYRQDGDEYITYQYLGDTNQLTFTMPDTPGVHEFRYKFRDSEVILTRPITVTLDKVEAAPDPAGLTPDMLVPVTLIAGMGDMGFAVQWSAVPAPGQNLPPEAWAMTDASSAPVEALLFPGDYDVTGIVPSGDDTFGGRITVVAGEENRFVLPVISTGAAGEDAPSGDLVSVTFRAEGYDGIVEWSAMPDGGTAADRLADTVAGGWQTTVTPGTWAVFGMAPDATFFGRVTVAAGQTDHVIPRERPIAAPPEAAPAGTISGTKLELTPETAAALRARLTGGN